MGIYRPKPEKLPRPTYWPFFLAFGVSCLLWGVLTTWIISVIGAIVFTVALIGWINDLYHEMKND